MNAYYSHYQEMKHMLTQTFFDTLKEYFRICSSIISGLRVNLKIMEVKDLLPNTDKEIILEKLSWLMIKVVLSYFKEKKKKLTSFFMI